MENRPTADWPGGGRDAPGTHWPLTAFARTEPFPEGFFMQRHRPAVMDETHVHSHVEILYPTRCSLTYWTPRGLNEAPEGRLSVLWGQLPHRLSGVSGAGEILIANVPLPDFLSWSLPDEFLALLFAGGLVVGASRDPLDRGLFARWVADYTRGEPDLTAIAHMELRLRLRRQTLAGWTRRDPGDGLREDLAGGRQAARVQTMIRFIAEHYTRPLSTDRIARAAGISSGHAMALFKRSLGLCINSYTTQLRLHHAKVALANSDESILNIALDAGFGSLSRFYEVFACHTAQTPRAWRLSHRASPRQHPTTSP